MSIDRYNDWIKDGDCECDFCKKIFKQSTILKSKILEIFGDDESWKKYFENCDNEILEVMGSLKKKISSIK